MGKWGFDLEIGPRVVFGPEGWSEFSAKPNWEYSATGWLDLIGGLSLTYTHQVQDFDSFEARPYLGIRPYYFTKHGIKGVKLANYFRVEYRAQYTFNTGAKANSVRLRNRIQVLVPINKTSIALDKAWHLIADLEGFYDPGNLRERFSARQRIRIGAGYRHSNTWRYQMIYTLQRARDTIDDPFSTTDYIFRFRVTHFF